MRCGNSPGTFSHLMAMVVSGLKCYLAFIDDTIVFGLSFEQHLKDVQLHRSSENKSGMYSGMAISEEHS